MAVLFSITCHLKNYEGYEILQSHKKLRLVCTDDCNRECDIDRSGVFEKLKFLFPRI